MIRRLRQWLSRRGDEQMVRSYDAAAPSRYLDKHFATADASDADSVILPSLAAVRNRCRYEVRNNTYAKGVIDTLANDIVGTGPRLQLMTDSPEFNRVAEARFVRWAERCDAAARQDLADLLRLAIYQLCESGEAFIHIFRDPSAGDRDTESLRLLAIEPDRVNSPPGHLFDDRIIEGIEHDDVGRPIRYYVEQSHPGGLLAGRQGPMGQYDVIEAAQMIHLARLDRPGQTRGMPWLTPALPLFGHLRRYTLAVIRAAETAASISGMLESDAPIGESQPVEEFEALEIEQDMLMTLPAGWRFNQVKSEQPTNTYEMFKREILNEIARCVNMPYNIAACNSSSYNYASGRLDWQVYYRHIDVVRNWLGRHVLDRVLKLWMAEAVLIDPALQLAPPVDRNHLDWFWPGAEHVDPAKEATAQAMRLKNYTTSLSAEYARQGKDWRDELKKIADERALMAELKIPINEVHADVTEKQTPDAGDDDDESAADRAVRLAR